MEIATGTRSVRRESQLMNEDPPAPDWMTGQWKDLKEVEGEDAYIVASCDDNHTASVVKWLNSDLHMCGPYINGKVDALWQDLP